MQQLPTVLLSPGGSERSYLQSRCVSLPYLSSVEYTNPHLFPADETGMSAAQLTTLCAASNQTAYCCVLVLFNGFGVGCISDLVVSEQQNSKELDFSNEKTVRVQVY